MKKPVYGTLVGEMAKGGIKKSDIASAIGVTPQTLRKKLNGITPFTWPEADAIQEQFFPQYGKDYLFKKG